MWATTSGFSQFGPCEVMALADAEQVEKEDAGSIPSGISRGGCLFEGFSESVAYRRSF